MASVAGGPITWSAERDDDGFRTYRITHRVKALRTEGPVAIMFASGLPEIGAGFSIAGYSGTDEWAWCRPEMSVSIDQQKQGDPALYYLVENIFSNRWEHGKSRRCQDTQIEDPLLEPMKVSGSFSKAQRVAQHDKDGVSLVTSANELIKGPPATFDYTRPIVRIEQNVASLGLSTFAAMVNTVNDAPLWGCPARCVKLTNAPWERKVCGSCTYFYTRTFEFEIDCYNHDKDGNLIGFDVEVPDMGSMVLHGQWHYNSEFPDGSPDPDYGRYEIMASVSRTDPEDVLTQPQSNFRPYKSMDDQPATVLLDGHGRPANTVWCRIDPTTKKVVDPGWTSGAPAKAVIRHYKESDFLRLGIPASL